MGSLFQGSPQTATSYTTTNTETPKWLQDAIYNQIQMATNVANKPYESYAFDTVAQLSPLQQQAYQQVQSNVGAWEPTLNAATNAMQGAINAPGGAAAAQPYFNQASNLTNAAASGSAVNAAAPYVSNASDLNYAAAAGSALNQANPYLNQAANLTNAGATGSSLNQANPYLGQANALALQSAAGNSADAANPYFGQANALSLASAGGSAANAANPYLANAAQTSTANIGQYMNPYQQNVMDVMAKQGARNLSENLLPAVSDSFIKAGQFGSGRMGEFGSRALRDTNESVMNQQAQLANTGYGQAVSASAADLARQAQLGSTAGQLSSTDLARQLSAAGQQAQIGTAQGQLSSTDLARQLSAAGQQGQLASTAGQLSSSDLSRLIQAGGQQAQIGSTAGQLSSSDLSRMLTAGSQEGQLASTMGNLSATDLSRLLSAGGQETQIGQAAGQLTGADLSRIQSGASAMGALGQQGQQLRTTDAAALESAGNVMRSVKQQQMDAAQNQYNAEVNYPKQQLDWLSTQVRGMAPIAPTSTTQSGTTTGGTYSASPLSQIASGMALYKGLS